MDQCAVSDALTYADDSFFFKVKFDDLETKV